MHVKHLKPKNLPISGQKFGHSLADVSIGPYKTTCVFTVGGDALIAPRGAIPERSGKTDMAVPLATGRCGHRPHKNNVRFQRWGRCPHRPVGYDTGAVKKNEHAHTIGFRADVGIGPYEKQHAFSPLVALPTKTTCVFSVGGDALIAP